MSKIKKKATSLQQLSKDEILKIEQGEKDIAVREGSKPMLHLLLYLKYKIYK